VARSSYGGYARPRRRRWRVPVALATVVVLVIAAVVGLLTYRSDQHHKSVRSQAQAVASVDGFVAAWQQQDATAMARYATPATAAYVRSEIPMLKSTLQISSLAITHGLVSSTTQPGAAITTRSVLQGLGTWSSTSRLRLVRLDGSWKVDFTSQTVTPSLASGDVLARSRTLGSRGVFVLADGTHVEGLDAELDGNLIGTTGAYTAAEAKAAGPDFEAGDVGGTSGLQRSYNAELAGTPGARLVVQSGNGTVVTTLLSRPTVDGRNVPLSLDLGTQHAAESALASLPATQTGSLVAIDVRTGGVLAIVNHPYDGYGRAIRGQYPPGSTFKIVTATAALMSGKTASTPLDCTSTVSVDGRTFKNSESEAYGDIDLETAFAKSCNTAFVRLEEELPAGAFAKAAALYGMSPLPASEQTTGPLPISSFGGSVPAPTDAADAAAEAFGQGRIVVSPLQMASIAAAAGSGTWHQPFVTATAPATEVTHPIPASVIATLHTFMAAVVSSGTAEGVGLPSGTYGKTGTAEYGAANPPATVAWFVGFRGDVAFACQVGGDTMSGGFGASAAAPIIRQFLDALG
jgi:beta-lactamase class D